jgi:hypothetical protein
VRNSFGRNDGSGATCRKEIGTPNPRREEPCGVEVTRTSCVDKVCRGRWNIDTLAVGRDDHGPRLATSETCDCAMAGDATSGLVEVFDFVERTDLVFIGKKNVDVMFNDL